MIAWCHAKSLIVQLQQNDQSLELPTVQKGVKGYVIIYPQCPMDLLNILPPTIDDIVTHICVIFIGSSHPSQDWLQNKAKPLIIRKKRCRLLSIKYSNDSNDFNNEIQSSSPYTSQSIVVTDINANMPAHELRVAAIKHFKQKEQSSFQFPHDPIPINEFNNPSMLPMTYPTLFSYGVGGPEDDKHPVKLLFQ
ncbi:hypothetical protein BDQ17DRAFT_1395225 [Cyathus striatus]|nr:hypothetical protein BDQ17DRAFT_1395225 [Cyathus striatus]